MTKVLRQKVKIQSGGVLEIRSHDLPDGMDVDVIVLIDEPAVTPPPLSRLIGAAKGCYANPKEADTFLRKERDQWD
ncbi:MAG: hypothetical protein C4527_12575 [Candidatus Omnitrophota bacterium]|jgi:hypothetical protein|nr:MAG: hypothetical protein C4527_12575 [Candidatus Omnitrophota bacterium]